MERKRRDYFRAGVRLVWQVNCQTQTAAVFTGPDQCTVVDEGGALEGGDVLPGFRLSWGEFLARVEGRKD